MAEQFASREAAEQAALALCAVVDKPAVVEILPSVTSPVSAIQFWAVRDELDLDSIPGIVVSLTVL